MNTVSTKQKTLDLIGMAEGMIQNNCKPKEMREITRLIVECITNLNLKQIRNELKKNGFIFREEYLYNEEDRIFELLTYYNSIRTNENDKKLMNEYNKLKDMIETYGTYTYIVKYKNKIMEWCDEYYNKLTSEPYDTSVTYNIKYISQIKNDIIEVYSKYVFDTKFNNNDNEVLNKINNKDTRKRFERFFEGKYSYDNRYIPKIEMDDIIILNNTMCNIIPCIMIDSDGWDNGENDKRMWSDDENYNKYRKYSLEPSTVFLGYGANTNMFNTLEELYNKVIELGGNIYKADGNKYINKTKLASNIRVLSDPIDHLSDVRDSYLKSMDILDHLKERLECFDKTTLRDDEVREFEFLNKIVNKINEYAK